VLIGLFALAKFVLHLATSSGYGYFRDELYYLACTEHLAAGYVDHPPLSVHWLALVRAALGDGLFALRLTPALLGAATVAVVGAMARDLGGRRWAMALAMAGALVAPVYLSLDHFYSMNAFDLLFWALAAWLVIRVAREAEADDDRLATWVALGVVLGLGLFNKIGVLWLGAGLAVGLLVTPLRRALLRPGPWVAGAVSAVIASPYLLWQVENGWPTREFIENATGTKMAAVAPLDFVANQIDMMSPFTLPLWVCGFFWLFFVRGARLWRVLGWMYLTVFAILLVSGSSRANYLAPAYTWLFAAGGVAIEDLSSKARARLGWLRPAYLAVLLGTGAMIAPLALPLLPIETYLRYAEALGQKPSTEERKELGELGQFYADMHGWREIVTTVAAATAKLAPEERAAARVFAPDYGVAGAIDLFGPRMDPPVPAAISGHNNYWLWGPRGWDGRVAIVVGGEESQLRALFAKVELAGTTDCGRCMPYENHRPVWIARGLQIPVDAAWLEVKHFD
jgi:hypothetical protein